MTLCLSRLTREQTKRKHTLRGSRDSKQTDSHVDRAHTRVRVSKEQTGPPLLPFFNSSSA